MRKQSRQFLHPGRQGPGATFLAVTLKVEAGLGGRGVRIRSQEMNDVRWQCLDLTTTEEVETVVKGIAEACNDETRSKMAVQILQSLSDSALLGVLQADLKKRRLSA